MRVLVKSAWMGEGREEGGAWWSPPLSLPPVANLWGRSSTMRHSSESIKRVEYTQTQYLYNILPVYSHRPTTNLEIDFKSAFRDLLFDELCVTKAELLLVVASLFKDGAKAIHHRWERMVVR